MRTGSWRAVGILYAPMNAWKKFHHMNEEYYPHKTTLSYETFSNKEGWENAPRDITGL